MQSNSKVVEEGLGTSVHSIHRLRYKATGRANIHNNTLLSAVRKILVVATVKSHLHCWMNQLQQRQSYDKVEVIVPLDHSRKHQVSHLHSTVHIDTDEIVDLLRAQVGKEFSVVVANTNIVH
jgi:hypothetical protein